MPGSSESEPTQNEGDPEEPPLQTGADDDSEGTGPPVEASDAASEENADGSADDEMDPDADPAERIVEAGAGVDILSEAERAELDDSTGGAEVDASDSADDAGAAAENDGGVSAPPEDQDADADDGTDAKPEEGVEEDAPQTLDDLVGDDDSSGETDETSGTSSTVAGPDSSDEADSTTETEPESDAEEVSTSATASSEPADGGEEHLSEPAGFDPVEGTDDEDDPAGADDEPSATEDGDDDSRIPDELRRLLEDDESDVGDESDGSDDGGDTATDGTEPGDEREDRREDTGGGSRREPRRDDQRRPREDPPRDGEYDRDRRRDQPRDDRYDSYRDPRPPRDDRRPRDEHYREPAREPRAASERRGPETRDLTPRVVDPEPPQTEGTAGTNQAAQQEPVSVRDEMAPAMAERQALLALIGALGMGSALATVGNILMLTRWEVIMALATGGVFALVVLTFIVFRAMLAAAERNGEPARSAYTHPLFLFLFLTSTLASGIFLGYVSRLLT